MRRCDTFVGLDGHYLRAAVRPGVAGARRGARRHREQRATAMTVRLATVIDVLDEAYPPGLAQSWDSVGLVCGDPDDVLSSVTIAVDATAAVVDRGSRRWPAAGPPSAAVARGGHGGGQYRQGRADTPPDPFRAFAVHRAHQCRLGVAGCV